MNLEYRAKYSVGITKVICRVFAIICTIIFTLHSSVFAAENIIIYPDARHLSITENLTFHDAAPSISVEVLRREVGENQFVTILSGDDTSPQWLSFALTNPSKQPIQRLLIAPHFGGGNDGLLMPILSGKRISQLYASSGLKPSLQQINGSDVFLIDLPPEKTITFVARVAESLPTRLSLWDVDAYENHQSYLPFYQGIIVGILGLLAIFISSLFIVKRDIIFIIAGLTSWAALTYSLQEFGFLTVILPENSYILALLRSLAEVAMSSLPLLLIFIFFNKSYRLKRIEMIIMAPVAIAAIGLVLAFISPSLAAGIARLNALLVMAFGFWLIIRHWPTHKFSTAQTLFPIWLMFSIWAIAQAYVAISTDTLYLNLLVGATYLLFLLMCFIALLQYFTQKSTENYVTNMPQSVVMQTANSMSTSQSSDVKAVQDEAHNDISNIAIAGSGQVLWEWDLLEGVIKCGADLDEALRYEYGTMSCVVSEWLTYLHSRDLPKLENAFSVILEEGNSRIDQDIRLRDVSGDFLWFELRAAALTDDEGYLTGFVGTLNEVTLRKNSEDRLLQDAVHDSLTGLPNRSLFIDRLKRAILRSEDKNNIMPAILLIDIDRFKALNDNVGIATGDSILMMIARRLEKFIISPNTVARMSADQFAVILTEYSDVNFVINFGEKMRKIISEPINIDDREIVLNSSVGIVLAEKGNENPDEFLHQAELALGSAKQMDKDAIVLYSDELAGSVGDRFTRENDLRQAITRNEFEMLYQPIIALENMQPVGFEALIRWHHPTDGNILPSDFIQLAEETGHIHALGQFALVEAAKQLNIWQRTFSQPVFVSVNMSSLQLFQPQLVEQVQDVLTRFNIANETLKLEITESLVMQNPELAGQILKRLKDIGTGLAIDDFGTGYSSLSYLHQFPFDVIKIDQSFIHGENFGETRPIILKTIINLARDLGLKVVAEGVEKDEQARELIDLGCEWVQGYRFGEPMSANEALDFLSSNFN
ncbi:MAG: sensor domain-containing phosphodiesterase [Hyphomicrobiales bacterium]|nr:MAG: sensor domain-containing phosphodiesterase [Hyphomicrobiales bacterium]